MSVRGRVALVLVLCMHIFSVPTARAWPMPAPLRTPRRSIFRSPAKQTAPTDQLGSYIDENGDIQPGPPLIKPGSPAAYDSAASSSSGGDIGVPNYEPYDAIIPDVPDYYDPPTIIGGDDSLPPFLRDPPGTGPVPVMISPDPPSPGPVPVIISPDPPSPGPVPVIISPAPVSSGAGSASGSSSGSASSGSGTGSASGSSSGSASSGSGSGSSSSSSSSSSASSTTGNILPGGASSVTTTSTSTSTTTTTGTGSGLDTIDDDDLSVSFADPDSAFKIVPMVPYDDEFDDILGDGIFYFRIPARRDYGAVLMKPACGMCIGYRYHQVPLRPLEDDPYMDGRDTMYAALIPVGMTQSEIADQMSFVEYILIMRSYTMDSPSAASPAASPAANPLTRRWSVEEAELSSIYN